MPDKSKLIEMYQNANVFKQCAHRSMGLIINENKIVFFQNNQNFILKAPTIVNIAFACELYLKMILLNQGVPVPKKHKLKQLYDFLSLETKNFLHKVCNLNQDDFEQLIQEYSNLFVEYRYFFDYKNKPNPRFIFLLDLTDALQEICKQIIENQ